MICSNDLTRGYYIVPPWSLANCKEQRIWELVVCVSEGECPLLSSDSVSTKFLLADGTWGIVFHKIIEAVLSGHYIEIIGHSKFLHKIFSASVGGCWVSYSSIQLAVKTIQIIINLYWLSHSNIYYVLEYLLFHLLSYILQSRFSLSLIFLGTVQAFPPVQTLFWNFVRLYGNDVLY